MITKILQDAAHADILACHKSLGDRSNDRGKGNAKQTVLQMRINLNSVANENIYELCQP